MIQFNNISQETPYLVFKDKYEDSLRAKQKNIEAISISSYSSSRNEVNARFVNLKFVNNKDFIFFLIISLQNHKNSINIIKL